jgi:putative ABC transport system ATP-binding protein
MLKIEDVTKTYATSHGPVAALAGVTAEINQGEFAVVRGPSGCGKTTLLLMLGGMLHPTSGTVTVADQGLYGLAANKRARFRSEQIGFVFQMFHLVAYLSVLDNVLLAGGSRGRKADDRARAEDLLKQFGLADRITHKPSELSAGERQRTAIARALFNRPTVLLADEPTGNLDPDNAAETVRYLQEYQKGQGGTVVMVTHSDTADSVADRIVRMKAGKLVE